MRIRGLRKSYQVSGRCLEVLKGLDLDVAEEGITVVLGRSGCGKTTLLRLIAGLETADSGEKITFSSKEREKEENSLVY